MLIFHGVPLCVPSHFLDLPNASPKGHTLPDLNTSHARSAKGRQRTSRAQQMCISGCEYLLVYCWMWSGEITIRNVTCTIYVTILPSLQSRFYAYLTINICKSWHYLVLLCKFLHLRYRTYNIQIWHHILWNNVISKHVKGIPMYMIWFNTITRMSPVIQLIPPWPGVQT